MSTNGREVPKKGGYTFTTMIAIAFPIVLLFFFIGVFVGSQVMHSVDEPSMLLGIYHSNSLVTNKAGSRDESISQTALRGAITSLQQQQQLAPQAQVMPTRHSEVLQHPASIVNQAPAAAAAPVKKTPSLVVRSGGQVVSGGAPVAPAANFGGASSSAVSGGAAAAVVVDEAAALKSSLHVSSAAASFRGPSDLDSAGVLLAAHIYLEDSPFDGDMRTIFSNKAPGCEVTPAGFGLSLYVNAWQTRDRQLYTEFGNDQSGCNKFGTTGLQLELERWHHVAVLHTDTEMALYLDDQVVAMETLGGRLRPHTPQTDRPLVVGQFDGGAFPFFGNISNVAAVRLDQADVLAAGGGAGAVARMMLPVVSQLGRVADAPSTPGLVALMSLREATVEKPGTKGAVLRPSGGGDSFGVFSFAAPVGAQGPMTVLSSGGLVNGLSGEPVTAEMIAASDALGMRRREDVKGAMQHAWRYYKQYAWGFDELKPLSHRGHNNWGGMGVTLVDSLDTLWIMGMKTEFNEARDWVRDKLSFDNAGSVSVFETTIRELGGLLSAYDLSGDEAFLKKAEILGGRLAGAFATSTGIARSSVNMKTGQGGNSWSGGSAILAELGTLQVEFRHLAHHTKNPQLEATCMKSLQLMRQRQPANGLFPIKIGIDSGNFADRTITFGALGDSFYEYLLKLWLQGNREETWLRSMYDKSMDGAIKVLLQKSNPSGLSYLSDWNGRNNVAKMDHLVCFMPGLLALGAYTDPLGGPDSDNPRSKRDLDVAKALMYTCYQMYHRQTSGISPEYVEFRPGKDIVVGSTAPFYILRPETAESLFVLSQLTKDPIYRDWSYEIFTSINKHCKTTYGFGALRDVSRPSAGVDDRMESFFLVETLKYLYMAQDPESAIYADLTKVVFNTEAHPLKNLQGHKPIP